MSQFWGSLKIIIGVPKESVLFLPNRTALDQMQMSTLLLSSSPKTHIPEVKP